MERTSDGVEANAVLLVLVDWGWICSTSKLYQTAIGTAQQKHNLSSTSYYTIKKGFDKANFFVLSIHDITKVVKRRTAVNNEFTRLGRQGHTHR